LVSVGGNKAVASRILNPFFKFMLKPRVRYTYIAKLHELTRFDRKEQMLYTCFEYAAIAEVEGDYLEFGVWRGANLIRAYHLSRRFNWLSKIRFHGFDSFMGIPELTQNQSEAAQFPPGSFRASLEEVTDNLKRGSVDMSRVALTEGWYSDSLKPETRRRLGIKAASVVYIDCDVYESTVPVLQFVQPCLVDGSIIVFDDWYCFGNKANLGEQKAFAEWLEQNPNLRATPYKEYGWDGKSFIINRE